MVRKNPLFFRKQQGIVPFFLFFLSDLEANQSTFEGARKARKLCERKHSDKTQFSGEQLVH